MRMGAVTLLVMVALLGGCAAEGTSHDADARVAPPSSATVIDEEPLPCVPGIEPFTGPAAEVFGPEPVMSAYCWLVELATEQVTTTLSRPVGQQREADLLALASHLTAGAARGWAALVRARAAGSASAARRVDGLTVHDVRVVPAGYATEPDGPHLHGTRTLPGSARPVRGGAALEVTFDVETGVVLRRRGDDSGQHSLLPVTRTASYVLVPDGDGWLIDEWHADFEHGQVRLVSR